MNFKFHPSPPLQEVIREEGGEKKASVAEEMPKDPRRSSSRLWFRGFFFLILKFPTSVISLYD
jgi:hypothetical protein